MFRNGDYFAENRYKVQRKQDDFGNLIEIQRKILYNAVEYVIPGGVLV